MLHCIVWPVQLAKLRIISTIEPTTHNSTIDVIALQPEGTSPLMPVL